MARFTPSRQGFEGGLVNIIIIVILAFAMLPIFTMVLMLALIPVAPVLWLLTIILLVLGMVQSTLDVGGNTLLVWVHRAGVGPYMNGLHLFWGLGATLSPVLIAQAISISGGITWAYWLLALLFLPVAIWVLLLPSPVARTTAVAAVRSPMSA